MGETFKQIGKLVVVVIGATYTVRGLDWMGRKVAAGYVGAKAQREAAKQQVQAAQQQQQAQHPNAGQQPNAQAAA